MGQGNTHAYVPDASDPVRLVAQVAAVLSIGAGVLHVSAAGDHTQLPVMFAGFMLVAILQIALGVLLLRRPLSRVLFAGAVAMMLSSIGLWVLSRTAGLPFIEGGHLEPIGFKDGVTKLFELASIPALLLLLSPDLSRVSVPPRFGSHALAIMGAGCFALMTPALLLGGGEQHSHAEAVALGIHEHDDASGDSHHLTADGSKSAHRHANDDAHSDAHGHGDSAHSEAGHVHTELASTTLGASHQHSSAGGHTHSGAPGHGGGSHHRGHHRDGGKQHHGGHGGHGHGDHGEGSEPEPAVSITYEPEPRICVASVCVP